MKTIKVDKVILYYMDRVDPDGNLYRFYMYKGMASEIEYFCTIDNEVKSIGMWMWGDVKGYVLEKKVAFTKKYKDKSREDEDCEEWEEVDSCWGCYEETDELIKEVMIENGLEE